MSVLAKVSDNATAHDADRGEPPHAALGGRGGTRHVTIPSHRNLSRYVS
jgi:hypothetical protein